MPFCLLGWITGVLYFQDCPIRTEDRAMSVLCIWLIEEVTSTQQRQHRLKVLQFYYYLHPMLPSRIVKSGLAGAAPAFQVGTRT